MATSTAHAGLLVGDHTARDARAVALAVVEAWECEVSVETLLLVLDELVDAVRERASTEYGLVLELSTHDGQGVRVTLADGSAVRATAEDVVRGAPVLAALLSSLTARWGDEPYRGGYSLWFDLVADGPAPPNGLPRSDEPDVDLDVEAYLQRRRGAGRSAPPAVDPAGVARLSAWFAGGEGR